MAATLAPQDIAHVVLERLAAAGIAPTPEQYARVYHEIAGSAFEPLPHDPAVKRTADKALYRARQAGKNCVLTEAAA